MGSVHLGPGPDPAWFELLGGNFEKLRGGFDQQDSEKDDWRE